MGEQTIPLTDPSASDPEAYGAAAQQMRVEADQAKEAQPRLTAYQATNSSLAPDRAAEVLQISKARGLAPAEVAGNYDAIAATHKEEQLAGALKDQPDLADYMAQSEAHAALVKGDVPVLSMMAQGLKLGVYGIGSALLGNKQGKVGLSPEEESALSEAEQLSAEGVPGATTLPRKVGAEVARATPTLALFGSAALAGGAAGSVLGPAGAAAGALLATVGTAFTVGWGPLYRRLRGLTQEDGVTPLLDDEHAKAWATAGAGAGAVAQVAIGAPFLKALPGVSGALQKVGLDAAARAASSTVGRAAVARLAEYGGHVLSGGLAMAAQSAVSAAAVEAARDPSRLALPSMRMGVINGAAGPGWAEVTDAAAEGFKTGLLLAPLAAFEPVRQFLEDKGRIQTAQLEAARLSALAAASKDLGIIPAAPAEAEKVLAPLAAGTDSQTVYVSPEALTPEAQQAVANVVGPEAMAEAQATGGAVSVPAEKYLVHLADQHEALAQDVKLSPDGMTPREAEEWQKKIADISEPLNAGKLTEIAARGLGRTPTEAEVRATMENLKALGFEIPETPPVVTGGTETPAPEPHPIAAAIASVPVEEQAKLAELIAPKKTPPRDKAPGKGVLDAVATRIVEMKRLGDIHPGQYEQQARKASDLLASIAAQTAKEAADNARAGIRTGLAAGIERAKDTTPGAEFVAGANKLGDPASAAEGIGAIEGNRDMNRALAAASADVRKEADKNRKFLLGFTKDDARAELGKAGGEYLDQVDRLLAGFELGQGASRTEVARRQATMAWIASEQAAGREPIIPDSVLAKLDRFVHWKELTPGELRDLRSAVESIAHQAKLKNTILEKQARVDRAQAKNELSTSAFANVPERPVLPQGSVVGNIEAGATAVRELAGALKRPEIYIRELDGGKIDGPWHRFLWDPIKDSKHGYYDLLDRVTRPIVDAASAMSSADKKRWLETRFKVNGITYDLKTSIAVMANLGNASNESKLVRGWADPSVAKRGLAPWTEDTPREFTRHLTRADVDMVQGVWDHLESMWPETSALEKRLTGLAPEKVQARAFSLWFDKDGRQVDPGTPGAEKVDYRGGYYPVIYDPQFSAQGARGAADGKLAGLFDPAYYRAATPQGHLQSRIESFARPVSLKIDALPRKINQAAKDTAMREALLSVHSLLTDDDMRAVMQRTIGVEGEKVMQSWVLDVANDQAIPDNGSGAWIDRANATKNRFTASLFAWNIGQTLQNLTGIVPAMKAVGPLRLATAIKQITTDRANVVAWINAQSGEMRSRKLAALPGVGDALESLARKEGLGARFTEFGLSVFEATDKAVAYPLWLASFDKAYSGGMEHDLAVKTANEAVRLKLMASATEDLPALMRSKVGKMLAPLYGYANNRLNAFFNARVDARAAAAGGQSFSYVKAIGAVWGVFAAEAVLSDLATGKGPEDYDGDGEITATDTAIWLGLRTALAPIYLVPIIGSMAKSLESGRDVTLIPETQIVTQAVRAGRSAFRIGKGAVSGDLSLDDDAFQKDMLEIGLLGAYGTGLPAAQIRSTTGFLIDDTQPADNPLQVGLGVAFGKKRPGKLLSLTE